MPSDSTARSGGLPADFFSASTFGTLSGCAVVTWVVTAVLSGVLRGDPKIVGLVVACVGWRLSTGFAARPDATVVAKQLAGVR